MITRPKYFETTEIAERMLLLVFALFLVCSRVTADSWSDICKDHPFIFHPGTGVAVTYDPKDVNSQQLAPSCTLEFLFGYPEKYAEKFCHARFYGDLTSYKMLPDKGLLQCVYASYQYCDGDDIQIDGACYRLHEKAKTLNEAKTECGQDNSHKMEMLTLKDQNAAEWILKLHDPNSDVVVPAIWFDTPINLFDPIDTWKDSEPDSNKTASVLRFRPDFPVPFAIFQSAKPVEKHPFYCRYNARKYPAAFRRFCEIVHDEFKLPAAYHHSTCFMMSTSVHRPKFINGKIDNTHYNDKCNFVDNMKTYAVAPTSRVKFEGILDAVTSSYPEDPYRTPRIVTPGRNKDSANTLYHTCKQQTRTAENTFQYIASDGKSYNVDTSGWDGESLRRECADLHRDIIVLAPNSGKKIGGQRIELGANDRLFAAYDYPRFFRGHLTCAAGFELKDIYSTKCEAGWTGTPRDDGTMACHQVITSPNLLTEKDQMIQMCKAASGQYLAPIESALEQQIIYGLVYEKLKAEGREKVPQSLMIGMSSPRGYDFHMDSDYIYKTPIYYSNWNDGEPNNYRNNERCAQMVFYPHDGKWNDIPCVQTYTGSSKYNVFGFVCSKPATRN